MIIASQVMESGMTLVTMDRAFDVIEEIDKVILD